MDFLIPCAAVLKRFYHEPAKNLKLLLSHKLDHLKSEENLQGVTRTVYGVIRYRRLLDFVIQRFSSRPLNEIQPDVLILLNIGTYLLLFSKSYPDYAVISEIVRVASRQSSGFINAILRNIARNRESLYETIKSIPDPEIAFSVSKVIVENLSLVSSDVEHDLEYLNCEPLFHLRVNTAVTTYNEARALLEKHQIRFKELEPFNSFEIKESGRVIRELMEKRYFYFQNTGSQVVSILAAQYAEKRVLDCCAAPGTKSVTTSLLKPSLMVFASDINPGRTRLIRDFVSQYQVGAIYPLVSDAANIAIKTGPKPAVDFVIVDAPCTSSGTLRKNPDLKLKIDQSLIDSNAENQYNILCSVLRLAPRYILYSVCSFTKNETEDVLEKFDRSYRDTKNTGLNTLDLSQELDLLGFRYKKGRYGFYLLPDERLNNDIFYISLLQI